jgi:hypothetical protein
MCVNYVIIKIDVVLQENLNVGIITIFNPNLEHVHFSAIFLNFCSFWFEMLQFWPFEEISIFSNGGHLGWRSGLLDTILTKTTVLSQVTDKLVSSTPYHEQESKSLTVVVLDTNCIARY